MLFLATLFVAGCRQLWRHSIPARWILVLSVVLPVAIALHLLQRKFIYLPWYGVPSLTGIILILAAGFIALFGKSRWVWKVCAPACAAVMITALWPQHWAMRTVPHGCNREAALLTRHILNPEHPEFGKDAITAYLAAFYKTYDVQAQRLEKLEDLEKLMTQSRAEQRPLFVNLAREGLVYGPGQEILKALRDPQQFETLPPLYGTDPEATHWIFKYLGK